MIIVMGTVTTCIRFGGGVPPGKDSHSLIQLFQSAFGIEVLGPLAQAANDELVVLIAQDDNVLA